MATFQTEVPDPQVSRVLDAFAALTEWTPESGITKQQNVKRAVASYIKEVVRQHEFQKAREEALSAVVTPPPPDVT